MIPEFKLKFPLNIKCPKWGIRKFEKWYRVPTLGKIPEFCLVIQIPQIHPPQQIPMHLSPIRKKLNIVPATLGIKILKPNPQPLGDFPHLCKGFHDPFVTKGTTHLSLTVSCLQRSDQVSVLQWRDAPDRAAMGHVEPGKE